MLIKTFISSCVQKSKTFTHCIQVEPSTYICWTSPFVILGVFCRFYSNFDGKLANTVDPDQTPHYYYYYDLGLHCLPITLLRVSRQEWVNGSRHMHINSDKIR